MKRFFLMVCAGLFVAPSLAQMYRAEYFFDADPGIKNGISVAATDPDGDAVFTLPPISTATLSHGFHFLGIRVLQNDVIFGVGYDQVNYFSFYDGTMTDHYVWSHTEGRAFYVSAPPLPTPSNITRAEYFFDTDPGPGNATAIPVTPGPTVNFTVPLPGGALSPGFHYLGIRVKNSVGWSVFDGQNFYVTAPVTDAADITGAEYFFDTDPGPGNGTRILVPPGPNPVFTVDLPAGTLPLGFHMLTIRVKGSDGKWGFFESKNFFVTTYNNAGTDLVAAEYFFDNDPGVGNGTPLMINPAEPSFNRNLTIPVPTTLALGSHRFSIRVKAADHTWSILETSTFTLNANQPPIASAGNDQTIRLPVSNAVLDGTSSTDPEAPIAAYTWSVVAGPPGATISNASQPIATAGNLIEGTYVFKLLVTDNVAATNSDLVQVTVLPPLPQPPPPPPANIPPTSNAGADQTIVLPESTTTLTSSSYDSDGAIATYSWVKISGPSGGAIVSPGQNSTNVTGLQQGVYQFELTVTDDKGATSIDIVQVTVNPRPCPAPAIVQIGDQLICNPPASSYQWYFNANPVSGATEQLLTIDLMAFGVYAVEITNGPGCQTRSPDFLYLITDVNDETDVSDIKVYPNPVTGALHVELSSDIQHPMILIDVLGRQAGKFQLRRGSNEIDMENFNPGLYYLLIGGARFKVQKI